jgi:hypothetical protein
MSLKWWVLQEMAIWSLRKTTVRPRSENKR